MNSLSFQSRSLWDRVYQVFMIHLQMLLSFPFCVVYVQAEEFLRKGLMLKPSDTDSRLLLVRLYLLQVKDAMSVT